MRYNPETERGILLDEVNRQCWQAVERRQSENPQPIGFARVWDCRNGGWTTVIR
jgi:hypothetical protein